ncbi:MAG TPA: hypothetical protein VN039_07400, partial [Nitrospira sp.]|nr:hypothetical protein [Nitrospira sp.]
AKSSSGRVGEKEYASPLRHWALTDSRPSADVTLIILRVADLAAALPVEKRVLARRGRAGEISSLFEHPEVILALAPYGRFQPYYSHQPSSSAVS